MFKIHNKKKFIQCSLLGVCAVALTGIVLTQTGQRSFSFLSGNATNENSITLNSSNAVSSAGDVTQKTAKGADVKFTYNNVTSGGHTKLNVGGYLVNKDQITSIETITCNFSGGTLKFKTSYDGATWGSDTVMTSGYEYPLGSNPYYVQFTAYSSAVTINNLYITYSCTPNPNAAGHVITEEASTYYQRVTSTQQATAGKYLIVYETDEKAFDGSLTSLDGEGNNKYIDLNDGIATIKSGDSHDFYFDYDGSGTFTSASGLNLGHSGSKNGMDGKDSNTVSFGTDGNAQIMGSGGLYLRFNSNTSNGNRFRYYGSTSQRDVYLYKQVVTQGGSHTEYDAPAESIIGFTATDSKANSYKTTDVFDTANGLTVVANLTGGTTQALSLGGVDGYSYVVKDSNGNPIDTSKAFGGKTSGTYTLIVSYKNFIPQEIPLTATFIRSVIGIGNVSLEKTTYNTAEQLNGNVDDLTCTLSYNDDTAEQVTYSSFASKGVELLLLTPSGVTYSQTTAFGTAGTWTLRVRLTSNASVYGEATITVNAIPVTGISVTGSSTSVEEGKTLQLTASVTPNTATNQSITWSSNATSVATVDANGLVTAVSAGEARITATAQDGSAAYGYIDITVTAKVAGADEGTFILNNNGAPEVGSYVVFASTYDGSGYAMSSTQNNNNRPGTAVTIANSSLTRESTSLFRAFRVEEGTTNDSISFYDEVADGYLYAAGGGNYLRTETTKSTNSSFTVTGSESKTITSKADVTQNIMRWNSTSTLFSCYGASSSIKGSVYIFEKSGDPIYATSISINGSNTVSVGSTTTLTVSFNPANTNVKAVSWTSSDDTVAGVEGGVVTGIKSGSVTITASVAGEGGTTISSTKNITISNVSVTSVSLNKSTTSITAGNTETLVATVNPSNATNKSVTWSTSDNSVATVDGGVVTAVAAGTAVITVTTVDGSKTASCTVTVTSSGGSSATGSQTYTFTSKSWAATEGNWTSGKDGNGYSNDGVQVTTGTTGANATSPKSFSSVQTIVVSYCTNASKGAGSIALQVGGSNFASSQSVTTSGGTTPRDMTFTGDGSLSGAVKISVTCTTNSIYICSITINYSTTPVDPTAISITPSSVELSPNGSKTLSVNYTPVGANQNKAVTWTSSNTNVATVDTSGKVTVKGTATVGQSATITARLTNLTSIYSTCTVTVIETANADHTVLVYICGADLESGSYRLASGDITEMLSVSGQPDDVNIVIETGGAKSWASTHGISSSYLQRHHVENRSLVTDEGNISYASMGLPSTLQSFIQYGIENFPADRYGLILWNHGGGMRGVCYDEKKSDDSLLDYEVKNAVSGALSAEGMAGQKLEWIGYDACLMQVQDIAEMNSPYFNYMIGSEESEAGEGWDYDTWVDDLYAKKTTPNILKAVVDGFIADNGGTNSSQNDQTLSYLDLSYASAYKTAWENMASQLSGKLNSSNKSSFNSLVKSCKYYADTDYTYFGLFDAKDFINKLANNSTFNPGSTYTNAVLTAHGNLVAYSSKGKGAGNSYGLAMYWSAASDSGKSTYYTSSHTNFTNWRNIVSTYGY